MKILCRLSTAIKMLCWTSLASFLLGCLTGAHGLVPAPGAAQSAPAARATRVVRVQPDERGREVPTWRPTRS